MDFFPAVLVYVSVHMSVCVKTPVGSISPFPFWILNKYLKLRQWNDTLVAVCFFEKPGGSFLAGLEGRERMLASAASPREVGRAGREIWHLSVWGGGTKSEGVQVP